MPALPGTKAKEKGLENKVTFEEADVMDVNLSEATLVLCYLITAASVALKPKFGGCACLAAR